MTGLIGLGGVMGIARLAIVRWARATGTVLRSTIVAMAAHPIRVA